MSDQEGAKGLGAEAFRDALYGDALSPKAEKAGRNLLIVSTLALFSKLFGISIKATPWVPLDFSQHPGAILKFLAIATVVMLINFALRVVADTMRRAELWAEVMAFIHHERVTRAYDAAKKIDDDVYASPEQQMDPEPWWEGVFETEREAQSAVERIRDRFGERRLPRLLHHVRLAMHAGLPILLGFLAVVVTAGDILEFLAAIWNHFIPADVGVFLTPTRV